MNKYKETKKAIQNIEMDIIHKLPDYSAGDKKGSIRKMKELMQKRKYDEDLIENINNDFCQGFDIAKRIIIEMCKNEIEKCKKMGEAKDDPFMGINPERLDFTAKIKTREKMLFYVMQQSTPGTEMYKETRAKHVELLHLMEELGLNQKKKTISKNGTRFELFIVNDEQYTDYEIGKCISEPDYGNGFSEFHDCVCMDAEEIAKELYAQTSGTYRYVIDVKYTYTSGSFYGEEPDNTYTYEIVSKEPSSYFQKYKNTRIIYFYRDFSSYIQDNEVIVPGAFTPEQIDMIMNSIKKFIYINREDRPDGGHFIPSQIGFSEKRFDDRINEDDHCWFELYRNGFKETYEEPTIDLTPEEIVNRFLAAKNNWKEYDLQSKNKKNEQT